MSGSLLAFDEDFPRAMNSTVPIRNTPSVAELRANNYPEPYHLLPIGVTSTPEQYCRAICTAGRSMRRLDRLIIFGHGQVVTAAVGVGSTQVTTGIVLGASPLTASNASLLSSPSIAFARNARVELWVCSAASANEVGGQSGVVLCQAIADALDVTVVASAITQNYSSQNQTEMPGGGWRSTVEFLPWDGELFRFTPRPRRRGTRR